MAADTAFPHTLLCLLKYLLHLDIMKQLAVTLFVGLLYCAYFSEKLRHLRKTFLIGIFCKTIIHIGPLIVLSLCRRKKILRCRPDMSKGFKPQLRMLLLIPGCL